MKNLLRGLYYNVTGLKTPKDWEPFSKLSIKSSNSNWVLDTIRTEMIDVCKEIKVPVINNRYVHKLTNQSIFYTSKYEVLDGFPNTRNRIAFPYYHGDPRRDLRFKRMLDALQINHKNISKIQVSQSYIENIVLNTGIDPKKVHRIPISIELDKFNYRSEGYKDIVRKDLNIPRSKILIGSFQKDGNGWGAGEEPKLIKGPDIFLEVIKALKPHYDDIAVLLTGPARGFVMKGLDEINVDYYHYNLEDYSEISNYYRALDLYLITAREEGGPRAVLESMASGVPLVTTRVGQAMDLVEHKVNGWIVDVEDVDGLVDCCKEVLEYQFDSESLLSNARRTAELNSYANQIPLWQDFMKDFVEV